MTKKTKVEAPEEVKEIKKDPEVAKRIAKVVAELGKAGHVIKTADTLKPQEIIRTGIFGLDYVLGKGIVQCEGGSRIEFWGGESTCKTTLSLYIAKKYQELGKICAFIDAERSYDFMWGNILGLDNKNLMILYPDTLEEFGDILVKLIPNVDLIIIDSIVSLIPLGESERNTEEALVAAQSRINSLITRKIYGAVKDRAVTFIFINQMRQKIGGYGNPDTSAGGNALRHLYSTRLQFKTGQPIKLGDEKIGNEIKLHCIKNKKGVPGRTTEIDFYLTGEIDNKKSLLFAGLKYNVIERNGNTYSFKDVKAVGQDNFKEAMQNNDWKDLEEEIWKVIK